MVAAALAACLLGERSIAQTTLDLEYLTHPLPQTLDGFGAGVAVGDVNGDGHLDIASSGCCIDWQGVTDAGGGVVFLGPDFVEKFSFGPLNPGANDKAGPVSAFELGDLDGDGFDDLLLGARHAKVAGINKVGRCWVLYGPTLQTGFEFSPPAIQFEVAFGTSGLFADFDDDGLLDVAVSSPQWSAPALYQGMIQVYWGSNGWPPPPGSAQQITTPTPTASVHTGAVMTSADLDGDGAPELVTRDFLNNNQGFLVLKGPSFSPSQHIPKPAGSVAKPSSIAFGDWNDDGVLDALVGVSLEAVGGLSQAGVIYRLHGPNWTTVGSMRSPFPSSGGWYGRFLAMADVDRDGFTDAVGASSTEDGSSGETDAGRVTIHYGPTFGTTQSFTGVTSSTWLGVGLAVRDLSGDGFPEIVTGSNNYTPQPVQGTGSVALIRHDALSTPVVQKISLAAGGTVPLSVEAGALSANQTYGILGSLSGDEPGVDLSSPVDAVHLNLNPDLMTDVMFLFANTPPLQGFVGTLDANGDAAATLTWPAGAGSPALAGSNLTLAALTLKSDGSFTFGSNALIVRLTP